MTKSILYGKDVIYLLDNVSYAEKEFLDKLFLFTNSLVIKDQKRADESESLESAKRSQEYMLAYSSRDTFSTYTNWSKRDIVGAGITDDGEIKKYLANPNIIPETYKDYMLRERRRSIIEGYDEINNYYRMLAGLPDWGEEPIRVSSGKYITELDSREFSNVAKTELDALIERYPDKEYLLHLGSKSVSIYDARSAKHFYILNYEKFIFEEERAKKFIELYYESMIYTINVLYTDAFSHQEYYEGFMTLFIIFMTMQKFINEQFNYAIRRDFFDLESIKNIFESYGLPFFSEIPIKYQRRLVKNLNQLLKYKGTNKVLVDITNIFGFQNAELFRYFLVKDFKRDSSGDIMIDKNNPRNSYELSFAQVPLDDKDISASLRKKHLYQSYEEVVHDDPFWGVNENEEDVTRDEFKEQLLDAEFNYINTKYMSMNTMFNMTQSNFEASYFFNMINDMEGKGLLDEMKFTNNQIKSSGNFIRVFDVVSAIYYLLFKRFGYDDNIIYTPTAVGTIYGFNFDGNLDELMGRIKEKAAIKFDNKVVNYKFDNITEKELKILAAPNINDQKEQLIDLYFKNKDYRNFLMDKIRKTNDYQEYKALSEIFNYNMYSESVKNLYANGPQDVYQTYSEYLKETDKELMEYLQLNSGNKEGIIKTIDTLLLSLEAYFNSERFEYIFSSLTNISGELVKQYMIKLVNIFKAYTVELKKINVYYVFDDRFVSTIRMFSVVRKNINSIKADSLDRDLTDAIGIGAVKISIEKELKELDEYYEMAKKAVFNEINELLMNDNISGLDVLLDKADNLLLNLMDFSERVSTFHKSEDLNRFVEFHALVSDIKYKEQLPLELKAELIEIEKSVLSHFEPIDYSLRDVTLFKEGQLDFKQDINILIIKPLQEMKLGLRGIMDNTVLLLTEADHLYHEGQDGIVRNHTLNKSDALSMRESFIIL